MDDKADDPRIGEAVRTPEGDEGVVEHVSVKVRMLVRYAAGQTRWHPVEALTRLGRERSRMNAAHELQRTALAVCAMFEGAKVAPDQRVGLDALEQWARIAATPTDTPEQR